MMVETKQKEFIQRQILEMDYLYELCKEHPIMGAAILERKNQYEEKLKNLS